MTLALFDLDNTLIAGDSDHYWGEFLVEKGVVDQHRYQKANDQFYRDYQAGSLDMQAYLNFALAPLAAHPLATMLRLRDAFINEKIAPIVLPKARELIEYHRHQNHTLIIITATNRFITEPIARLLRVAHLIATEPEFNQGAYTGKATGTPCYQEGKIVNLEKWLLDHPELNESLNESYFYSDSFNDLPLLSRVSFPVAIDPDSNLREHSEKNGWPIKSLR